MNVSLEDPITLSIAFAGDCKTAMIWTYPEFKKMCKELKADNMQSLGGKISGMKKDIKNDPSLFLKIYEFTFRYYLDPGMKNIECDTALALWPLTMQD